MRTCVETGREGQKRGEGAAGQGAPDASGAKWREQAHETRSLRTWEKDSGGPGARDAWQNPQFGHMALFRPTPPRLGGVGRRGVFDCRVGHERVVFGGGARKSASCRLAPERAHRVLCFHCYKSPEQEAKSQQIVGQSLLSCLQYPVPYISRLQRIYPSQHSKLRWSMMLGRSLS